MIFNKDVQTRDQIIKANSDFYDESFEGGIKHFKRLKPAALYKLIDQQFADPDDYQNMAPTIQEFLEFAQKYPELKPTFSGYAVESKRDDYRVSIDEIVLENPVINSRSTLIAFAELTRNSDDIIDYADNKTNDNAIGIWWD